MDMVYCPRCNVLLDFEEVTVRGVDVYDYSQINNIVKIKQERRDVR